MSTQSLKETKPDYDQLAWLGQQIYNGISAVVTTAGKAVSAVKHVLEFDEHEANPAVLYSERLHYLQSPSNVKLGNLPTNWVKPAPSFTRIAREQNILPAITAEERIDESHQANYQTCREAVLQELFELQDGKLVTKDS